MQQEVQIPQNLEFNPAGLGGIYSEKIHLTEESQAMGVNVILEILAQDDSRNKVGNIFMPEQATLNMDMLKARIVSVGVEAAKLNLKVDDVILYDKWSRFYNPPETPGTFVITEAQNIICKLKQ